ncbi:MAG: serine/threonine protein kinase [Polyangiaceae bacterium]|nr:serine/threonine protein kinase [Polyangiaceae bacterium]
MAETVLLEATFDARWRQLGLADTLALSRLDATITPEAAGELQASGERPTWTRPDAQGLPRISVSFAGAAGGATSPPAGGADFEVLALLGEGGMGQVHLARQRSLHRDVAVKTARAERPAAAHALLREAVIAGSLEHPGIVPVHALGVDHAGGPVLVMKRVEGVEWRTLLHDPEHAAWNTRSGDRLTVHLEVLMQVCQAVHFAHSRGIVHRDIKPENVMLGDYGEVYLVDWGVAVRAGSDAAETSGLVGTPTYMAPEMVAGRGVDARTDVYLLGATLHEVLTGSFRNQGETLQEVLLSAFCAEPASYEPSLPRELAELCTRCTAREPAERPETALAVRDALAAFLRHRGSTELAASACERLRVLDGLFAESKQDGPSDVLRAYQLGGECRFGLTRALEIWPENAQARQALSHCLTLLARLELAQGHIDAARALIVELDRVPDYLQEALSLARQKAAQTRAEHKRLRAMALDLDVRVGASQRARAFAAITGAAIATTLLVALIPNAERLKPIALLGLAIFFQVVVVVVAAIWRQALLANAFNRRLVYAMLIAGFGLIAHRCVAVLAGTPTPRVLVYDSLLLATVAMMFAATALAAFWLPALVYVLAAALALAFPAHSPGIFGGAMVVALVLMTRAIASHLEQERLKEAETEPLSRLGG